MKIMCDDTRIQQQTGVASSGNTLIGQQINYVGLSPTEASQLAINLFENNFPKLQEQTMQEVYRLVREFWTTTVEKMIFEKIQDFSAFKTPDMQYVLVEAQTNYARFASDELLSMLSSLVVQRVKADKDEYYKLVLDKAISVVPSLTASQIDALTLLFYCKKVHFGKVKTLEQLKTLYEMIDGVFTPCGDGGYSLLNTLGCLDLDLGDVATKASEVYSLNKRDIESICPPNIRNLHCDYSPSHVGIVIAIINSNNKTNFHFDPHIWIRE